VSPEFLADLHQDAAQHVPPAAVTAIAPGVVRVGVFDELRVPGVDQEL
jgi:hypothetical protein